jgi:hypothetical protein
MTSFRNRRRALLLGLATVAACDVAQVALEPKFPGLIQTWNFAAEEQSIWVRDLLPSGVTILPDSSAFVVDVDDVNFSRRLGGYCGLCQVLNGTTAPKPAFIISPDTGGTSNLPANTDSAMVISGKVRYTITNNMSFDVLRVKAAGLPSEQGWMVIVVRSGSLVLGRDSVNGASQAMPAGSVYVDSIDLTSGVVRSAITVDLTVNSPAGDNTFINANGLLLTNGVVSELRVAQVGIQVTSAPLTPTQKDVPSGLPDPIIDNLIGGRMEMTITNPWAVTGTVNVRFDVPPATVINKPLPFPTGTAVLRSVTLDSAEINNIFAATEQNPSLFSMTGALSQSGPGISVTPRQTVTITNRMVLLVRVGGE